MTIHVTNLQQRIIDGLRERGPLRGRQLDAAFSHIEWRRSARALVAQRTADQPGGAAQTQGQPKDSPGGAIVHSCSTAG